MKSLVVVTPFFNEAGNLAPFIEQLKRLAVEVRDTYALHLEAIFVDDGSTDGGADTVADLLPADWRLVKLTRNFGKEAALLAGLDRADHDYVLTMDADLQHSNETAHRLIDTLLANPDADMAYAALAKRVNQPFAAQLSRLFYWFINIAQRFSIPADACDFRVMTRRCAEALRQIRDRRRFNKGLYSWTGYRQIGIQFQLDRRGSGKSKWSRLNLAALSLEAITSFSVMPMRVMSSIGAVAAFAGLLFGIRIILEKLIWGIDVPGYPSLMVAVLVMGGLNLLLLGIIGEYVWVTLLESKDRPVYLVDRVIDGERANAAARQPAKKRKTQALPVK